MRKLLSLVFTLSALFTAFIFCAFAYENEDYYKNSGLEGTEINVLLSPIPNLQLREESIIKVLYYLS